MSFRQNNKSEGAQWRKNHRVELLAAGLPESIIDDERNWNYLLLHGDDQFGSGWCPSHITNEQATRLLLLLRSQSIWTETGHEIFRVLTQKTART